MKSMPRAILFAAAMLAGTTATGYAADAVTFYEHVAPTDGLTYLAVAALLIACAAAASILPARWAARLDTVRALRDE